MKSCGKIFFILILSGCLEEYTQQFIIYSDPVVPISATEVSIQSKFVDLPSTIRSYGYCWSENLNPTIIDDSIKIIGGISIEEFNGKISRLGINKQYYVRAYLEDERGLFHYGNELEFLNNFSPEFLTIRLNGITETYFEIFSEIKISGDYSVSKYGHVWSKNQLPTLDDEFTELGSISIDELHKSFVSQLKDLEKNTKYYVRPYAINDWGVFYGDQIVLSVPEIIVTGLWSEMLVPEAGTYPPFYYCVLNDNSNLYFFTGNDGSYSSLEDIDMSYFPNDFSRSCSNVNLMNNTVTLIKEFPGSLRAFSKGFMVEGIAYVGFGAFLEYYATTSNFDMWAYNPSTNIWKTRSKLPATDGHVVFCASNSDYGFAGVQKNGIIELWRYQPSNNSWLKIGTSIPIEGVPGGAIINGNSLYFSCDNQVIVFDLTGNTWQKIGDFQAALFFLYKNNVYALGMYYDVYMYEGFNNWKQKSFLPVGREYLKHYVNSETGFSCQEETLVSFNFEGETIVGVYISPEYLDWIPDQSLWFKYSEK